MRYIWTLLLVLLLPQLIMAQGAVWVKYYDKKGELAGYKDLNGRIKIPAQFLHYSIPDSFHHIIAVEDTLYNQYYLLKNGKKVARDSVYMFDYMFDCEREGKILFKDKKSKNVGFLDVNGRVVIPAIYNYATPFCNNISLALIGAELKCLDKGCEHSSYVGGKTVLINAKNEIIVDNWQDDSDKINWYSVKIDDPALDRPGCVDVGGTDGRVYSFQSYNSEFVSWYYRKFLPALKAGEVSKYVMSEIKSWSDDKGEWLHWPKAHFLRTNTSLMRDILLINRDKIDISSGDLIFNDNLYKSYRNSCGQHDAERYPVFTVTKTYSNGDAASNRQENFDFIRTTNGYLLYAVSIK
jgi:hypothetical protein